MSKPEMASDDLKRTYVQLRKHCIWVLTCFNTFIDLFESGEARHKLMDSTAPLFFHDLNIILFEYYILQVCKLTDKARTHGGKSARLNLTVAHLNELLVDDALLTPEIAAATDGLMRFRGVVEKARNRSIGHSDKETALKYAVLGAHTQSEARAFFESLQAYVNAVGNAVGEGPLDFSTTSAAGDAHDLFKALNGGRYPRDGEDR
jgi:hypothetical protein